MSVLDKLQASANLRSYQTGTARLNSPVQNPITLRDRMHKNLHAAFYLGMHRMMLHLPVDWVSAFGAHIGWFIVSRYKPKALHQARRNIARLKPELTSDQIEAFCERLYRNIGRVIFEFACLPRLFPQGRFKISGAEHLKAACAQGPVVLIYLHIGNWEGISPLMQHLGQKFSDIYEPPHTEVELRIANEMRRSFGVDLLPPGPAAARPALRRLQAGGCVAIFCDELRNSLIMAPFFGRPPHTKGNLALAARLARRTGAKIIIGYIVRQKECSFEANFLPAIELTPQAEERPAADEVVLADVIRLNSLIEPIITTHLDQWYFADNDL